MVVQDEVDLQVPHVVDLPCEREALLGPYAKEAHRVLQDPCAKEAHPVLQDPYAKEAHWAHQDPYVKEAPQVQNGEVLIHLVPQVLQVEGVHLARHVEVHHEVLHQGPYEKLFLQVPYDVGMHQDSQIQDIHEAGPQVRHVVALHEAAHRVLHEAVRQVLHEADLGARLMDILDLAILVHPHIIWDLEE